MRKRKSHPQMDQLLEVVRPWWMKLGLLILILLSLSTVAGYRINVSASLPRGIYQIGRAPASLESGAIVVVCLSQSWSRLALERRILGSGTCPGGSYGIGKIVVGTAGDIVTISRDRLLIGNIALMNGTTLERDRIGRPMPHHPWGRHTLRTGELWLYSCHPSAFDSRYFGPVARKQVRAVVEPIYRAPGFLGHSIGIN